MVVVNTTAVYRIIRQSLKQLVNNKKSFDFPRVGEFINFQGSI